ncbi:GHKL domain-containing protein [Eubacterium sp. 1001713B170207_170306_E7]|uniref:GHKL domain-containing protein n=1 Tax=Eubacterium sp. 1001713B170207_170306_E7 TaxID=2787097 RepID=UPI00189928BB|nr:GHKL domain-containing protein [Eubacterium sp. 1001713B170207_170306_E7]
MMAGNFYQSFLRASLALLCTIGLVFVMTEFRYSRRKCLLIIFFYFIASMTINGVILYVAGLSVLFRYFLLTTTLPCVILLAVLAKDDIFKAQFNFWTQINLFFAIAVLSYYGTKAVGGGFYTELFMRLLSYGVVFLLYTRYLRRPFRLFTKSLETGWVLISFVPILFCAVIMSLVLFPTIFYERPQILPTLGLVYLTMFGVYAVIFITFQRSYELTTARREAEFLGLQINLQKRQFDTQQQKMEVIRMYRHDMRHHIGIITAFLQDGHPEKAEAYSRRIQSMIDETAYYQFCENYLVNTLVSLYTELAMTKGITICSELSIPKELFVEDTDLCVIFSNALENALNACAKLPAADERSISLICRNYPDKLVIEINNTFNGQAEFSEEGLPVNHDEHHGIGTQSIAFIVKKYNGILHYKTEHCLFTLQILLNH